MCVRALSAIQVVVAQRFNNKHPLLSFLFIRHPAISANIIVCIAHSAFIAEGFRIQ